MRDLHPVQAGKEFLNIDIVEVFFRHSTSAYLHILPKCYFIY